MNGRTNRSPVEYSDLGDTQVLGRLGPVPGKPGLLSPFMYISDDVDISEFSGRGGVASLLMWVPPPLIGEVGFGGSTLDQFFEVMLTKKIGEPDNASGKCSGRSTDRNNSTCLCEVYQLLDHGRTAQRCLVFSSATKLSMRHIAPDYSARPCVLPTEAAGAGGRFLGLAIEPVNQMVNLIGKKISVRDPFQELTADNASALSSEVGLNLHLKSSSGVKCVSRPGRVILPSEGFHSHDQWETPTSTAINKSSTGGASCERNDSVVIQRHISTSPQLDDCSVRETFVPTRGENSNNVRTNQR